MKKYLSKTQSPVTAEDREIMNNVPYASAIGSIMYAILCTRQDVCHAVSLTSRYKVIQEWNTGQLSRISLSI